VRYHAKPDYDWRLLTAAALLTVQQRNVVREEDNVQKQDNCRGTNASAAAKRIDAKREFAVNRVGNFEANQKNSAVI
jgi:hypothetical protein